MSSTTSSWVQTLRRLSLVVDSTSSSVFGVFSGLKSKWDWCQFAGEEVVDFDVVRDLLVAAGSPYFLSIVARSAAVLTLRSPWLHKPRKIRSQISNKKPFYDTQNLSIRCTNIIFEQFYKNALNFFSSLRCNLLVRRSVYPSIPLPSRLFTFQLTINKTVFFFTTALFLSGYVLQQQTVRDLRAAIKPQLVRSKPGPDLYLPPQFQDAEYWEARGVVDAVTVEELQESSEERGRTGTGDSEEGKGNGDGEEDDMIGATRWQKAAKRKKKLMEEKALKEAQKSMVENERGELEQDAIPKQPEKPIGRAERRRRIKEQILAEGEGEGFKGYKRRMW
jgi:hypothetical protein